MGQVSFKYSAFKKKKSMSMKCGILDVVSGVFIVVVLFKCQKSQIIQELVMFRQDYDAELMIMHLGYRLLQLQGSGTRH